MKQPPLKPSASSEASTRAILTRVLPAARVALGWTQDYLAEKARVGRATISQTELGNRYTNLRTAQAIQNALEEGGIEFLPETETHGPGIRLRKGVP